MVYSVLLTRDGAQDLEGLISFIETQDDPGKAKRVLLRIEKAFAGLTTNPNRGTHPPELLELGIREYRQVYFKPYRILYRVLDDKVYVMLITDGRRDMQTLLERRLLEG